jgi:hypothetical protein
MPDLTPTRQARELAPGLALVTYRAIRAAPGALAVQSLRSSIWACRDGRWQMLFHQGTRI